MAGEVVHLAAPVVSGGRANIIASPFQWLFTGEDNLRIVAYNALADTGLRIEGRFLSRAGVIEVFHHDMRLTADRAASVAAFKMGDGFLLNLSIAAIGNNPRVGQTFVLAQLIRGLREAFIVIGQILGGYCTGNQRLTYPGSPVVTSIEGGGYLRFVQGTDPAGAAEITETVPTNARWELIACLASLVTSAAAGARAASLRVTNGGGLVKWHVPYYEAIPASATRSLVWGQGLTHRDTVAPNTVATLPLPTNQQLLAGDTIETSSSLFAGDGWGAPQLTLREWFEVA